jgi:hypothetical protein
MYLRFTTKLVALDGLMVNMLTIGPKFAVSNPAESVGFSMATKIRSKTCFWEKIKPPGPCRSILWHVITSCRYEERYFVGTFTATFCEFSPPSLPYVSVGYCERGLVVGIGIMRTQTEMHNRSETVAILGTPCAVPPHNSISITKLTINHL